MNLSIQSILHLSRFVNRFTGDFEMLKYSNNEQLIQGNIHPRYVPFVQIWQELFDKRTLDIYQYRVMTSLSALKELESVLVKTLSGLFTSDANVTACREETLYILKQDPLLDKHYKPHLNRLYSALGATPKSDASKNALLFQVRYILKKIDEAYLSVALSELKDGIDQGDIPTIINYTNIIASQAVHDGWSPQALMKMLRFFKEEDTTLEAQWNNFQGELLRTDLDDHAVLINLPFPSQNRQELEDVLSSLELSVKTHEDLMRDFSHIDGIASTFKARNVYLQFNVPAKDVHTASHKAILEAAQWLNLASFYNLLNAWDLSTVKFVTINIRNNYVQRFNAKDLYDTYDYVDSSGRIFENTKSIFLDQNKFAIKERLQGSFGYTNISRASLFQEEKYMNLWVALESLARTDMYSDIISNVKETVPAATSLRYIYRLIRNFIEDCVRCGINLTFSTRIIDTQQITKQTMVRQFIAILQDNALLQELKDKCLVHSLLAYRVDEIVKLVTDVPYAAQKIENYHQRVNWQIQRMYRIRNEITHAALLEKTMLLVYIEHLYDYLSTYISEIVTCLTTKGLDSLESTLCCIKDNYDVFIALSNERNPELVKSTTMKTGIIDLL